MRVLVLFALFVLLSESHTLRRRLDERIEQLKQIKVLLYIPTHLSSLHAKALKHIWPGLVVDSNLLKHVDVLFFVPTEQLSFAKEFSNIFTPSQNVTFETYENSGWENGFGGNHQGGAMHAITAGYKRGYFANYDWVIRLNADTLILDDTQLIDAILNQSVGALLVECGDNLDTRIPPRIIAHTDFTVWRPDRAPYDGIPENPVTAEILMTSILRPILLNKQAIYIKGNSPNRGFCRVYGERSPVVHHHVYTEALIKCVEEQSHSDAIEIIRVYAKNCIDTIDRKISDKREWND